MVNVEEVAPVEVGANWSVILHFFFGISCAGQVVATVLNSSGLTGESDAIGWPKVIGGPFFAALVRVSDALLVLPNFTSPKFFDDGLTFNCSGT